MKELIKTLILNIPKKIKFDVRISVDTERNPLYTSSTSSGDLYTSFSIFPTVIVTIMHDVESAEKLTWNKNDGLLMTKYTYPIFVNEFKNMNEDMKIPQLYTYDGNRLVLNEKLADSKRKVFKIANTMIELSPVVIEPSLDDLSQKYMEGIKIKFNNETSSTVLTLNEAISFLWNMEHLDIDNLAFNMYNSFYGKVVPVLKNDTAVPDIDIKLPDKFSTITDEI